MGIIQSILDNDLYKFTMQKAVMNYKQNVPVRYIFKNRRPEGKFTLDFLDHFENEIQQMKNLTLTSDQCDWLRQTLPWLGEDYIQYLRNYRFDPSEVQWRIHQGELELEIVGIWERTILWEVPLMALISELFFVHCDKNWDSNQEIQRRKIQAKGITLDGWSFSDFGTRRRRNFKTQQLVVKTLKNFSTFGGTSNVHLAHEMDVRPIGTMAHEWIMGISALEGLRHANRDAMRIWQGVYKGQLGYALTDTYTADVFFKDFDSVLARTYDGVRHDSGCPFEFAAKTIEAYNRLGISPKTKTIIFSDGLTPETAVDIAKCCAGKINTSFGIGTNFTNDYKGSPALNIVIKLAECDGVPVVKLSDIPAKAIGDIDALRVAKWTFFKTSLDES